MSTLILVALDKGFFVVHALLIAFNMVGWAWKRTRLAHLVTLGLTTFSWFVLGAFYGFGFCVCTQWHFDVRRALGYQDTEYSFVQLLATHWFGRELSEESSNWLAGTVFGGVVVATAIVWGRLAFKRRKEAADGNR